MKRNPHKTKETILKAATKKFALKGMAGTRVDEIAADSGLNKGMIYHYFGDKQGLYVQVLTGQMRHMFQHMQKPKGDTEYEVIHKAVETYFDYCWCNPEYISLMLWEMVSGWNTLNCIPNETENDVQHFLIETIETGIKKGTFHADTNPRLFMSLAIVQIFCFFPLFKHPHLLHYRHGTDLPESEVQYYKEKVVAHVMRALKPGVSRTLSTTEEHV